MEPMRNRRRLHLLGVAVACSIAIPATAAAHIPEPAASLPMPLQLRVLQPGELLDLVPAGAGQLVAAGARDPLRARVGERSVLSTTGAGLRYAFVERLASPSMSVKAVSVAVEFTSARAARDQITAWHAGQQMTPPAVSVARAVESRGRTGWSVAFADGDFAYLIDTSWNTGTRNPPTRAQLIAAAAELYKRVHEHPAS